MVVNNGAVGWNDGVQELTFMIGTESYGEEDHGKEAGTNKFAMSEWPLSSLSHKRRMLISRVCRGLS